MAERQVYTIHVTKRTNGVQKHKRIKVRASSAEAAQRHAEKVADTEGGPWQ